LSDVVLFRNPAHVGSLKKIAYLLLTVEDEVIIAIIWRMAGIAGELDKESARTAQPVS